MLYKTFQCISMVLVIFWGGMRRQIVDFESEKKKVSSLLTEVNISIEHAINVPSTLSGEDSHATSATRRSMPPYEACINSDSLGELSRRQPAQDCPRQPQDSRLTCVLGSPPRCQATGCHRASFLPTRISAVSHLNRKMSM